MTDKPLKFIIEHGAIDFYVVRVGGVATNAGPTSRLVIFQAKTEAKAAAFLQVYLTLAIEDRRKLREACA